jgi:hypothetical protein
MTALSDQIYRLEFEAMPEDHPGLYYLLGPDLPLALSRAAELAARDEGPVVLCSSRALEWRHPDQLGTVWADGSFHPESPSSGPAPL